MKATNNVLSKWRGNEFESSTTKTDEFKQFARDFKKAVKEQTQSEFDIVSYNAGHFYVSGFLKSKEDGGKFVYFSIPDVRDSNDEWANNILVRTAKHEKDFSGGMNQYTNLTSFAEKVQKLVS